MALAFVRRSLIKKNYILLYGCVVFLPDEQFTVACPDIGAHDYANLFRSKAISSFIRVHYFQINCTPFFSAANLDDKFKRKQVERR